MRRNNWFVAAGLTLVLAACAGDEGASPTAAEDSPAADATTSPAETTAESPAESPAAGGDDIGELGEMLDEPDLYLDKDVAVVADVGSAIENANAWILQASDEDVLLLGPEDADVEATAGDTLEIRGRFMEFNPATLGDIESVVNEAAIADAFDGAYVIVAESIDAAES